MKLLRASDAGFRDAWARLIDGSGIVHPVAMEYDIAYQRAYLADSVVEEQDLSAIASTDAGIPLCGVRAFLIRDKSGESQISCMGRPIAFFETSEENQESEAAFKRIKEEIQKMLSLDLRAELRFRDYAWNGSLSKLALFLLDLGARARPAITQVMDLSASEEELRSDLRKSFRSLVNWGMSELELQIHDSKTLKRAAFDEFHALHRLAAGRETRANESWERQYESIRDGDAFLVVGYLGGRMVTGGLFNIGRGYCLYGVGASDRDLFEKPLSHALIWKAMLHAKSVGLRYFEAGEQVFPSFPVENVSEKEVSIAMFKRGFGGCSRYLLDLSLRANGVRA